MRQAKRVECGLALALVLAACGGLDPSDFGQTKPEATEAGAAGWSYRPPLSNGGHAGTQPTPLRAQGGSSSRGGVGGAPASSNGAATGTAGAAGAAGAAGDDDAGGSSELGGAGGRAVTVGGMAGFSAGRSGGGATSNAGTHAGGSSFASGGHGGEASPHGAGGAEGGRAGTHGSAGTHSAGSSGSVGTAGSANGGSGGTSEPRALLFSEYVESGTKKALEIRAVTATNLHGCEIFTYYGNANGEPSSSHFAIDGTLAAGAAYVLCSSQLAAMANVHCDRSTNLRFNGNDALALVCEGTTLDVIGEIGIDPGTAWTGGDASTVDQTLRRRCSVTHGDPIGTDAFDPSVEWLALPNATFDGLGSPACGE